MDVTILIVEYHCIGQVADCLSSVRKWLDALEWECIVVSNSEYIESECEKYREELACEHFVVSPKNLGYAGGVNFGAKYASSSLLFVLNPDSILPDASVVEMIKWFSNKPELGAAGPQVIDEQGMIQPSSRRFPRPWTFLMARSFLCKTRLGRAESSRYFMRDYDRKQIREVDWVSGGAVLLRIDAFSDIGGLDDRYFLYMEDVDLCKSLHAAGYGVAYYPDASVIHAGQHASISLNIKSLQEPHFRWHISSLWKYFRKWGIRK